MDRSMQGFSRRGFALASGAAVLAASRLGAQEPAAGGKPKQEPAAGPVEAPFERDYPPPEFKPSWKNPQLNRQLVQDFVIFAHSELDQVRILLDREPALINATIDWGAGDWESGLGGASHMGRDDIVSLLLERGARPDLFCAAMMDSWKSSVHC
jgi:hypothetical protein